SAGVDVVRLGVLPTPAVAYLTGATGSDLGVMLSASHNPMPDNGIKFLARGGIKLDDAIEDAIEARMGEEWQRPTAADVGRVTDDDRGFETYVSHLVRSAPNRFDGLKVVIDCANGAASATAPEALRRLGAEVITYAAAPDGLNINLDCGSTHIEGLQREVLGHRADVGIALDGDADRCLAVDANGELVDGDQILAVLAMAMRDSGRLSNDTVVATVMSNLGFVQAMVREQIAVEQTKVGDRYVLEAMKAGGHKLGGEQSGHVILSDHATTGDGTLTAVMLLARVAQTGKSLSDLAGAMTRLPQVLVNVKNVDKSRAGTDPAVQSAVADATTRLGDSGRVLLRPSGTEPLVRVMVEAESSDTADEIARSLADVVATSLKL
ncbi:MAG TPA: phosphoglucosamine mutase, partial [Kribbella sp.]